MKNRGKLSFHRRSGERGQTIILVAVALVSLLGMAALAIDVVTLYVARSEMQRAADAAALAGAKAFVDSGVTSLATTDPNYATVQGLAQTMATTVINSIVPQNRIQGTAPVLVGAGVRLHPAWKSAGERHAAADRSAPFFPHLGRTLNREHGCGY